ncbi:hypothetical protein K4K49_010415 [Colletotrichum sp. SAR 10_70]|uniref:uncharacterized protein n=1 Tax=Colletotrichum siamense TaxID=690259 RepID=UPI00187262F5|nr:uncharacterized protein CGCS363_v002611 [Colletotrichum siamense]KAI8151690.1 hypothetical protein K4K50_010351 [Colletotrichum sp. SAR 10_71]KAI8153161.1 hypothetical protein K4K49_010415 [Colletotrichum sp. SAR 10_70]KAI8196461.1 hypothetical protein K4K52_011390 [Colletotrichum sp. SAR 10_76]KAI8197232.1 hypothetical protein KHU50_009688 [Colletotrichum sp. SAR 10_65]KAI8250550.1 hypothetical protein K4K58_009665 [Colletotrichum sp. SAR11_239]
MASRFVLASTPIARGAFVVGRQTAAFSTTRFMGLKESANQTDHEKHKQDSLHKQKQGKGHWKPELASDSEEALKADRNTEGVDPKTLAERTKKAAEETSKAGTSMREGL